MTNNPSNNQQNTSEEVDLGQLFKIIGQLFDRFFNFIGSIFKAIFSVFIYALKAIIVNFKLIAAVIVVSALLGFGLEKTKPTTYKSQMLVKPYFDSQYEMITNVRNLNSLVSTQRYETLAELFKMDVDEVKAIAGIEINPGPESENDQYRAYDEYVKSIDTVSGIELTFKQYISNRSIYEYRIYEISVLSNKKDIYKGLENGIIESFNTEYSKNKMKKRDQVIEIQRENLLTSIREIDSLQNVYIKVLEDENKTGGNVIELAEGLTIGKDKTTTKEFELLSQELLLRDALKELEEEKILEDVPFEVLSGFQAIGNKASIIEKYVVVFPAIAFLLLCLVFLTNKLVKFVNKYEE